MSANLLASAVELESMSLAQLVALHNMFPVPSVKKFASKPAAIKRIQAAQVDLAAANAALEPASPVEPAPAVEAPVEPAPASAPVAFQYLTRDALKELAATDAAARAAYRVERRKAARAARKAKKAASKAA